MNPLAIEDMLFNYKNNKTWAENLSIPMQIGLTMSGCIVFCCWVGYWIDKYLDTKGVFTIIFILLGIAGGGIVAYRQILEILNDGEKK